MAHPYHHALSSVKKWGGTVEDYVNGGAKVGHGGGVKPGQLVRMCAMVRALST